MDKKNIAGMIATIKNIYPYFAKDSDVVSLAKTWEILLADIPDEISEVAFYECLRACKMPPTPADIIEKAKGLMRAGDPSDEELWGVFIKALRQTSDQLCRFNYSAKTEIGKTQGEIAREKVDEIWDELPERLQMYLGSKGEMMRMSWYSDDDMRFEKGRFLKTMPIIADRQEYARLTQVALPYKQKTMLEAEN